MTSRTGTLTNVGPSLTSTPLQLSQHTNATSLSTIWESTVSPSAWPVSLACFLTPLGAALSYSIILGDATTSLAAAAGFSLARPYAILGLAGTALYRLCRLSDLSALAPVSIVGVMGILATTGEMDARSDVRRRAKRDKRRCAVRRRAKQNKRRCAAKASEARQAPNAQRWAGGCEPKYRS